MATTVIDLGTGSAGAAPAPTNLEYPIIARPPWIEPPASAESFLFNSGVAVMPAIGAQITIVSFVVPRGRSGRIWRVANYSNLTGGIARWVNGSGALVWQILKNGVPFKNFNNIVCAVGLVENGGSKLSAGLALRANDNISLVVNNVSIPAAGQILAGLLGGYYYPQDLDPKTLR